MPRVASLLRFCLGLLIGSATVEAGLRAIETGPLWRVLPVADASLYGPDDATGYAHRPGARGIRTPENRTKVAINTLGLRDRLDRQETKPPQSIRWVVAGDSIIEAQQVPLEQTFAYLAEEKLSQARSQTFEVVNLGLAGARPAVIIERLRTRLPSLDPDGLVVFLSAGELLSDEPENASEYAGYIAGPDGTAVISHAFLDGRAHAFRKSELGQAVYWALDHVRLALVLNNRKNAGLLAELAGAAPEPDPPSDPCWDNTIDRLEALWSHSPSGFASHRLKAVLDALATFGREQSMPVIVALRDLRSDCRAQDGRFAALDDTITRRLANAGLGFLNVERELLRTLPEGASLASLYGFKDRLGSGHLNSAGHRAYADVLARTIASQHTKPVPLLRN